MAQRTGRGRESFDRRTRGGSTATRILVIGVVVLLAVAPLTAGFTGLSTAASASEETTKLDIVFVFDRSESTNDDRYNMAQEIDSLDDRLDAAGIDARFGLITYNTDDRIEQPLTSDFSEFERAMHYQEAGNEERASDAIPTATGMDFRENATRVVVLFTDEDDDSTSAARTTALSALEDVQFIAISPALPYDSSCAIHSPPCDNETSNELRTMADQVDGTWIDVSQDAETIVDRLGDVLDPQTSTNTNQGGSTSSPDFMTINRSTNVSTAEVGDRIAFSKTVENTGSASGTYDAYLSYKGKILAEQTVDIPAQSSRTITFVRSFNETGTYQLQISHETVGSVDVIAPRDASVTTKMQDDGSSVGASVTDVSVNGSVTVPVNGSAMSPAAVGTVRNVTFSVGDVDVTPSHDVAFDVEVSANSSPPNGTAPLPDHVTNGTYLDVTHTLGSGLVGMQFEYETRSNATMLFGYDANASEWVPLSRTAVGTVNGTTTWQTDTSNYSTFAIGVGHPDFDVTDASLHAQQITKGETAGVTVTVANVGSATGTHTVTVSMNGETYVGEVTVPTSGTDEVVLRFTAEQEGTHTVQVDGASDLTLDVKPAMTTTEEPTTTTTTAEPTTTETSTPSTTTDEEVSEILAPGFGLVTMVLAVVLLGLLALRRR